MTDDQRPFNLNKQLTERLDVELALQAAGLGVWEVNLITNQVLWDDRCRQLFGIDQYQISYSDTLHHIHPQDVERVNQAIQWALNPQSDGTYQATYRSIGEDGRTRWVQSTGRRYVNPAGQPVRFAGVSQDVTPQVEARQQAQRQQRISEAITASSPDLMYVFDLAYRFTYANQALLDMWGSSWEASMGKGLLDNGYEPWHAEMHEREIDQVVATKQPIRGEVSFPHATLGRRIYDYVFAPVFNESGQVEAVAGTTRDITGLLVARQHTQESEAKLRSIINSAPTAIGVFVGPDMVVENPNQLLIELLGQGPDLEGKSFRQLLSGVVDEDQKFIQLIDTVRTTGQPFEAKEVAVFFKLDKRTRYFNISFVPLRDESGIIYAVLDVSVDVTLQVVARQAIESSEHILRDMVLSAPIGISILNAADLVIETVNDAFMEIAGKTYEQLMGQPYWIPFAEAAPYYAHALNRVVQQGEAFSIDEVELMLIRHGKEEMIYVTFFYLPLKDATGQVKKVVVWVLENTHQVTQRRKVEEQVQQRTEELAAANQELAATNEELEANNEAYAAINEELEEANGLLNRSNENLQQFAYVASHDLQEPLRKIQQFGDLLKTRYADSVGEELVYVERMQSAAKRMSTLIKDLLDFSRIAPQRQASGLVSLDDILGQVLIMLELTIQETGAQVSVEPVPTVMGDASQLSQLFQNLLSNALKFRRPGIVPTIAVKANWLAADHLSEGVRPSRGAIAYHRIEVVDNGIGFDEKYVDRIFQVFQRLHGKSEYAGTGIGLAICEKVVANHGGAITARSQPGQGASFTIYLPA